MNSFTYKNYTGSIKASLEDNCLHGNIEHISDLVNYEASTIQELKVEFEKAVDDYLDHCKRVNKEPNQSFKGSFKIKLGKEIHEKATMKASKVGKSLNDYIKDVINKDIESHI